MSNSEVPDFLPEYLAQPEVELCLGYFTKEYADGVTAVYEINDDGTLSDVETRFPDRGLHYESGAYDTPVYFKKV